MFLSPFRLPFKHVVAVSMETTQEGDLQPAAAPSSTPVFLTVLTSLLKSVLEANASRGPSSHPFATFCSGLLKEDPPPGVCGLPEQSCDHTQAVTDGVPLYPLYRQLAASLQVWISVGLLPRSLPDFAGIAEDETSTSKIHGWTRRTVELGSNLQELLRRARFQVHVQEPYYSLLKEGKKTIEGRCHSGLYKSVKAGDHLLVNCSLLLRVNAISWYPTFQKLLEEEGLTKVLPGVLTIAEGVQVYRKFYSEADELEHGALALHVASVPTQPIEVVETLVSELNVEGLRTLLGLRKTVGSNLDMLPPPRSALLSSFSKLTTDTTSALQGEGKKPSSVLTVGARALAKHANRSSCGWWGACTGTEAVKNDQALNVVCKLLDHATWINIHHVPPDFQTFEIRVAEGYGARWSADGEEFRGFLEPPIEQGHAKKWRH